MDLLPQEVEVWYVLPALRKELAKAFLKMGKKKKDVAMLLKITQAAVSHYSKNKRANFVKFPPAFELEIEKAARVILKKPENYLTEVLRLCAIVRNMKLICDIHRSNDNAVDSGCDICFAPGEKSI